MAKATEKKAIKTETTKEEKPRKKREAVSAEFIGDIFRLHVAGVSKLRDMQDAAALCSEDQQTGEIEPNPMHTTALVGAIRRLESHIAASKKSVSESGHRGKFVEVFESFLAAWKTEIDEFWEIVDSRERS